ncbi:MAG: hypothetical protein P0S96_08345 [Simkaniaceae bacterium]|nr:hypothetical protein [Candidatus Sacchlamyda saccharinae]
MIKKILFSLLVSVQILAAEEVHFCGDMRVNMLKGWDKLLTWTLLPKIKPYYFSNPLVIQTYEMHDAFLESFRKEYGYFSAYEPIVGIVTDEASHVEKTNEALKNLVHLPDSLQREFSRDEILAKVMAYRTLKKGMKITMPDGAIYFVDTIIDLWRGMPAFGLLPEQKGHPPILLYRGTDMDLVSEKGWASILSDLDTTGPGHTTFLKAQDQIHQWLLKVKKTYQPARVVGYSLGGALVFYTLIYESDLLSRKYPTVAYNPPGISLEVHAKWEEAKQAKDIPLFTFVNKGDIVSQIGFFLSNVWEISLDKTMDVIEAHTTLISTESHFHATSVDVAKENEARMAMLRRR